MANPTKHEEGHGAAHGHGIGRYLIVWAFLIVGTILTVITGRIDLGAGNIFLAITIASIKATLVVLFFMHMSETPAANRIVFVTSIVFAIVLIVGVFGDLLTRNTMTLPSAAPSTEGPEFQVPASATPGHEP